MCDKNGAESIVPLIVTFTISKISPECRDVCHHGRIKLAKMAYEIYLKAIQGRQECELGLRCSYSSPSSAA